jgi:hypothetical protein
MHNSKLQALIKGSDKEETSLLQLTEHTVISNLCRVIAGKLKV